MLPLAVDAPGRLGKHPEALGVDRARATLAKAVRAGSHLLNGAGDDQLPLNQHPTQCFTYVSRLQRLRAFDVVGVVDQGSVANACDGRLERVKSCLQLPAVARGYPVMRRGGS